LVYVFYVVVGLASMGLIVKVWVEQPETRLPLREPIHRRW
jgi:hypothetical protein